MTTQAVETVLARLSNAGLNLSLAFSGGLAVGPTRRLTPYLSVLIRRNKTQLIDWLTAANDAASHEPISTVNPADWKQLAKAYYAHHVNCPTCIAAGRGSRYGQRCGEGMVLWRVYYYLRATPDSS
jgi:hypothetical protein